MKIALLSAIPIVPAFGGNRRRILDLCRAIRSLGHELTFVYIPSPFTEAPDLDAHRAELGQDAVLGLSPRHIRSPAFRLNRLPHQVRRKALARTRLDASYYYGLDEFAPASMREELRGLQRAHAFDAVVCQYVFYSSLLDAFPASVLKILDTHDSFADRHRLYESRSAYWYSLPPGEQLRGFRRADRVVAIQSEEAAQFRAALGSAPPEVVEVSHILDTRSPVETFASGDALLLGSANQANVGSARYAIEAVLPRVRAVLPDFRLVIAGQLCEAVGDASGVRKLGTVDELRDAFTAAPISLNPMLAGTGINIKLLDAMAHGVPTVSTQTGLRGLDARYRSGIVAVPDDDPQRFADEIVRLARDPALRERSGRAAFADAQRWNDRQIAALRSVLHAPGAGDPAASNPVAASSERALEGVR